MKTRNKFILVKLETEYGTDPTPADVNAILTTGLTRTMYDGNTVSRNFDKATLGLDTTVNTAPYCMVEFSVELAGSGAAGTAPAFAPLLLACGFAETVVTDTSVTYDPVSSDFDSVTIYYFRDGERQVIKGARGSVTFSLSAGGYPMMNFRMVGFYGKPTAPAAIVPDVSNFTDPLPVNNTNTPTCTLDSYDVILQSMTLNMNAETPYMNMVNLEEVFYVDRAPSADLTFLAPTIAQKDIMGLVESHAGTITTSAFNLVHGTTAGNIVTISAPAVQLSGLSETDINGEQGYQTSALFIPDTGDDEVAVAFT